MLIGLVAAALGSLSWAALVEANIRRGADFPWAVPVMALLLAAWWIYFARGLGWPASTGENRRILARANPVPDPLWGPALGTGVLGLIGVLLLQGVLGRLAVLPQQQDIDPSRFPLATVVAWVIMSAIVAGVVEETTLRGYVQGAIERRYGPVVAILVNAGLFGLAHFTHREWGGVLLPYYMSVAAVYGVLAYATDSTFPSMVLHAGGNMLSAFGLFVQGRSEWELGNGRAALVWESGVDAAFVANVLALLVVSAATVMASRALIALGRPKGDPVRIKGWT